MNEELIQYLSRRFDKVDFDLTNVKSDLVNIKQDLKEAEQERKDLKSRINETYNAVDGFIKIVTKLEDEFAAIKEDLNRVKAVIKEKLGVDLS